MDGYNNLRLKSFWIQRYEPQLSQEQYFQDQINPSVLFELFSTIIRPLVISEIPEYRPTIFTDQMRIRRVYIENSRFIFSSYEFHRIANPAIESPKFSRAKKQSRGFFFTGSWRLANDRFIENFATSKETKSMENCFPCCTTVSIYMYKEAWIHKYSASDWASKSGKGDPGGECIASMLDIYVSLCLPALYRFSPPAPCPALSRNYDLVNCARGRKWRDRGNPHERERRNSWTSSETERKRSSCCIDSLYRFASFSSLVYWYEHGQFDADSKFSSRKFFFSFFFFQFH